MIDHPYPTTKIQWIPDQVRCVCSIRVVHVPLKDLHYTLHYPMILLYH